MPEKQTMKALELPDMTFDELRAALREAYCNAISEVTDACFAQVLLPSDQATLALDVTQFTVFMMALKTVANNRQDLTRQNLLQTFRRIEKHIGRELPAMLIEYIRAVERGEVG